MIGSLFTELVLTNLKRNQDDTICTCAYCGSFTKNIVVRTLLIGAMGAPSRMIGYFLLMLPDNFMTIICRFL